MTTRVRFPYCVKLQRRPGDHLVNLEFLADVHSWLDATYSRGTDYLPGANPFTYWFEDQGAALLFKLTWGGQ